MCGRKQRIARDREQRISCGIDHSRFSPGKGALLICYGCLNGSNDA